MGRIGSIPPEACVGIGTWVRQRPTAIGVHFFCMGDTSVTVVQPHPAPPATQSADPGAAAATAAATTPPAVPAKGWRAVWGRVLSALQVTLASFLLAIVYVIFVLSVSGGSPAPSSPHPAFQGSQTLHHAQNV